MTKKTHESRNIGQNCFRFASPSQKFRNKFGPVLDFSDVIRRRRQNEVPIWASKEHWERSFCGKVNSSPSFVLNVGTFANTTREGFSLMVNTLIIAYSGGTFLSQSVIPGLHRSDRTRPAMKCWRVSRAVLVEIRDATRRCRGGRTNGNGTSEFRRSIVLFYCFVFYLLKRKFWKRSVLSDEMSKRVNRSVRFDTKRIQFGRDSSWSPHVLGCSRENNRWSFRWIWFLLRRPRMETTECRWSSRIEVRWRRRRRRLFHWPIELFDWWQILPLRSLDLDDWSRRSIASASFLCRETSIESVSTADRWCSETRRIPVGCWRDEQSVHWNNVRGGNQERRNHRKHRRRSVRTSVRLCSMDFVLRSFPSLLLAIDESFLRSSLSDCSTFRRLAALASVLHRVVSLVRRARQSICRPSPIRWEQRSGRDRPDRRERERRSTPDERRSSEDWRSERVWRTTYTSCLCHSSTALRGENRTRLHSRPDRLRPS